MTTDHDPLLDQIDRLPLMPDGVSVNVARIDGRLHLTISHSGGIASLPVDPQTGTVDATALRQAVADVMIARLDGSDR